MPKPTRKEREFARRESEILDAAISLFSGPDWEQVTVEQIAKQAEIGKGTVYKHFSSKEEIHAKVAIEFNAQLLDIFKNLDLNQPVDAVLREMIHVSFDLFLSNHAQARVELCCSRLDFIANLSPSLQKEFSDYEEKFDVFISGILERGIEEGSIPRRPIAHLMVGMKATFNGAMTLIWSGDVIESEGMELEEMVTIIGDYMVAGVIGLSPSLSNPSKTK